MEFNVLEESKTKIIFTLEGETHTFCNLLKNEIQDVKGVVLITYSINHPLVGVPKFILETKGAEPRKVLKEALVSLKMKVASFQKEVAKL